VADDRSDVEVSLTNRINVRRSWLGLSAQDRAKRTEPARRKRLENLANKRDPNHELPDDERERQARELQRIELLEYVERSVAKARKKADRRKKSQNGGENGAAGPSSGPANSVTADHRSGSDGTTAPA
jgi:hypothetical protein